MQVENNKHSVTSILRLHPLILGLFILAGVLLAFKAQALIVVIEDEPKHSKLYNTSVTINDQEFGGYADIVNTEIRWVSGHPQVVFELGEPLPNPDDNVDPRYVNILTSWWLSDTLPPFAGHPSVVCSVSNAVSPSSSDNNNNILTCQLQGNKNITVDVLTPKRFIVVDALIVSFDNVENMEENQVRIEPINVQGNINVDGDPSDWDNAALQSHIVAYSDNTTSNDPYGFTDIKELKVVALKGENNKYTIYLLAQARNNFNYTIGVPYLRLTASIDYEYVDASSSENVTGTYRFGILIGNGRIKIRAAGRGELLLDKKCGSDYCNVSVNGTYLEASLSSLALEGALRTALNLGNSVSFNQINVTLTGAALAVVVHDRPLSRPRARDYIALDLNKKLIYVDNAQAASLCLDSGQSSTIKGVVTAVNITNTGNNRLCVDVLKFNVNPFGIEEIEVPGVSLGEYFLVIPTMPLDGTVRFNVSLHVFEDKAAALLHTLNISTTACRAAIVSADAASIEPSIVAYHYLDEKVELNKAYWVFGYCPITVAWPQASIATVKQGETASHLVHVANYDLAHSDQVAISTPGGYTSNSTQVTLPAVLRETTMRPSSFNITLDTSRLRPGIYKAWINLTSRGNTKAQVKLVTVVVPSTTAFVEKQGVRGTVEVVVPRINAKVKITTTAQARVKLAPLRDVVEGLTGRPARKILLADKAIDVIVDKPSKLSRIEVSYTDDDIRRWNVVEGSLRLYRWDPLLGRWVPFRRTGVDTVNNIVWAEPAPSELIGVPVAPVGDPVQLVGGELELPLGLASKDSNRTTILAAVAGAALVLIAVFLSMYRRK
ncbi:MAG: hypothetical protein DSY37_03875 [Hyperthermus sp.]|nr:MAG: hypothetical protein DSY37_03875 [Hyperthermus sp.]